LHYGSTYQVAAELSATACDCIVHTDVQVALCESKSGVFVELKYIPMDVTAITTFH